MRRLNESLDYKALIKKIEERDKASVAAENRIVRERKAAVKAFLAFMKKASTKKKVSSLCSLGWILMTNRETARTVFDKFTASKGEIGFSSFNGFYNAHSSDDITVGVGSGPRIMIDKTGTAYVVNSRRKDRCVPFEEIADEIISNESGMWGSSLVTTEIRTLMDLDGFEYRLNNQFQF